MSLPAAFAVRGFKLMHWERLPGDMQWRTFRWKCFDGLLRLPDHAIQIVAVMNSNPGSGRLGKLMNEFEKIADEERRTLQVTQIWNDRLAAWFVRRGYALAENPELGRHVERKISV